MPSKALEVNLACSRVDVTIGEKYDALQAVMSKYYGIREGLDAFLKELEHPYKNWEFIVREARGYALDYLHLVQSHPKGPDAARLFVDIFMEAIESSHDKEVMADAVDNLNLYLQKIIKGSGDRIKERRRASAYHTQGTDEWILSSALWAFLQPTASCSGTARRRSSSIRAATSRPFGRLSGQGSSSSF